jgi:hypothetical protein
LGGHDVGLSWAIWETESGIRLSSIFRRELYVHDGIFIAAVLACGFLVGIWRMSARIGADR